MLSDMFRPTYHFFNNELSENFCSRVEEYIKNIKLDDATVYGDLTEKVLKRDVDLEVDIDNYDWIILIGSEALKYYTKESSVTEYSGRVVNDKFLPVINPAMLAFKPEAKKTWEESCENIKKYIAGELKQAKLGKDKCYGITEKARYSMSKLHYIKMTLLFL